MLSFEKYVDSEATIEKLISKYLETYVDFAKIKTRVTSDEDTNATDQEEVVVTIFSTNNEFASDEDKQEDSEETIAIRTKVILHQDLRIVVEGYDKTQTQKVLFLLNHLLTKKQLIREFASNGVMLRTSKNFVGTTRSKKQNESLLTTFGFNITCESAYIIREDQNFMTYNGLEIIYET